MTTRARRGWVARFAALGLTTALGAGCSGDAALPRAVEADTETTTAPAAPPQPECTPAQQREERTRSYEPTEPLPAPGALPAGSTMAAIQQKGRLIVGVSGDTRQFGARNPVTGAIEGFDIDILKEVAKAIFGVADPPIEYRIITYAQRLPSLEDGTVDIVAHTMTINCNRWLRIAFSSEYYAAGQKVLVRTGSGFTGIEDLAAAGGRICVPGGSTNLEEIRKSAYAGVEIVERLDITDCLVAFQQGQADAITADDTVLVGFAAQDPYAEVVGDAFTKEPYGLGINLEHTDFVRFVNSVLEAIRTNGRWSEIYARWVGGDAVEIPAATYGRIPPEEAG
ncbi:MAG: glutamate ABC transporter substrate-binding protein [Ilumatobacteraceae bacterium]